jgi:hypothetical protein
MRRCPSSPLPPSPTRGEGGVRGVLKPEAGEADTDIRQHRGVTVLLVKGRSYAQPDPRAFADAILRRE